MHRRRWLLMILAQVIAFSAVFAGSLFAELGRGNSLPVAVVYALAPILGFAAVSTLMAPIYRRQPGHDRS